MGRFLAFGALVLVGGAAAFVAAGYAGGERHIVFEWFRMAGGFSGGSLCAFVGGAIWLAFLGRARARDGRPRLLTFWLAILPALIGALATYLGWEMIQAGLARNDGTTKLMLLNRGMFEANTARFIGFLLSTLLCLVLVALAGVRGPAAGATRLAAPDIRLETRVSTAMMAGLSLLCVTAAIIGAPSGALIAGVAAAILGLGLALPTRHTPAAARDPLERSLAGLLALGLAVAASFARVEGRQSVLWGPELTRAERAAEITAANGEWTATLVIALATCALLVGLQFFRWRRLHRLGALRRPRTTAMILLLVLGLGAAADTFLHARFLAAREALRAELAPQFTLFAQLDPPAAPELAAETFVPHRAPALQLARDAVAIDGKGVAKLAALDGAVGAMNLARDLGHVLTGPVAHGAPDLAVSVDRSVPYRVVVRVLRIARDAGVRKIELLFTRGAPPKLTPSSAPETAYVIATDFVAIAATLADTGLDFAGDKRFSEVAPTLIGAAIKTRGPVALAVPPSL